MSEDTGLEALLRATSLSHGRIAIYVMNGQWSCDIAHINGHLVHQPKHHGDPVTALRAALIEDERRSRDQVRRYEAAPKAGAYTQEMTDEFSEAQAQIAAEVEADEMEDLLG
jgi:hypothetical protein